MSWISLSLPSPSFLFFSFLTWRLLLLLLSHFSRVWLCATAETAAHQAPPSLGFSRQEHWGGLPFPSPMHESENSKWSRSVVSDSYRPHGLQCTRLLCPWDSPGKSTGVGVPLSSLGLQIVFKPEMIRDRKHSLSGFLNRVFSTRLQKYDWIFTSIYEL